MRAVAYVRVSSKGQDLRSQRHAIETMAEAQGDAVTFFEEKRTATTLKRPVLDRVRAEARSGRIKRLYVFRLDRLTRTGIRDTFDLIEELRAHRCEIFTCADGFDLNGPLAEPIIAILAWAAKMEHFARSERIAAARARKEADGESWGRPRRMTPAQETKALQLHSKGYSQRQIAIRVKIPHATIGRFLRRASK